MSIVVKRVTTRRDLKRFVSFPHSLYAGHPYWVPPLRYMEMRTLQPETNPAFEFCEAACWLACRDGRIVGRVAGIINRRYIEAWGNKCARFGWIDFVDDQAVSESLMNTVERWAQDRGIQAVHGPLGFTDLDREGMLVDGFDELGTMATIYNFPYYPEHLERCGYCKDTDWVEYELSEPENAAKRLGRIAAVAMRKNSLRTVRVKRVKELLPYARDMFNVLNSAYANLYGFVALTERQIDMYVKQYFKFVCPDFVGLAIDAADKVAGFIVGMPSLSRALQKANGRLFPFGFVHMLKAMKKYDTIDMFLIGVRPELQGKGVNALVINEINRACLKNGVIKAQAHPQLEDNRDVQGQWDVYRSRLHKRRRCYIKHFTTSA